MERKGPREAAGFTPMAPQPCKSRGSGPNHLATRHGLATPEPAKPRKSHKLPSSPEICWCQMPIKDPKMSYIRSPKGSRNAELTLFSHLDKHLGSAQDLTA
ncbi:hypothetical protein Y1Q_0014669 [Alligator mississippiensis]|uniref:Uncharacterized protein n=1 Tax=Alligator mississippiensis TaxID=8496 RepID=A0A151P900_ALLMI|nr:hypothetical protein Y1Q_0014669 [Alligator mississippiensis]